MPGVYDVPQWEPLGLSLFFEFPPSFDREAFKRRLVSVFCLPTRVGNVLGVSKDGVVLLADGDTLPIEPKIVGLEGAVLGPVLYNLFGAHVAVCRHGSLCVCRDTELPVGLGKVLEKFPPPYLVPVLAPFLGESLGGEPLRLGPISPESSSGGFV